MGKKEGDQQGQRETLWMITTFGVKGIFPPCITSVDVRNFGAWNLILIAANDSILQFFSVAVASLLLDIHRPCGSDVEEPVLPTSLDSVLLDFYSKNFFLYISPSLPTPRVRACLDHILAQNTTI
jgi:hypothetical protein